VRFRDLQGKHLYGARGEMEETMKNTEKDMGTSIVGVSGMNVPSEWRKFSDLLIVFVCVYGVYKYPSGAISRTTESNQGTLERIRSQRKFRHTKDMRTIYVIMAREKGW